MEVTLPWMWIAVVSLVTWIGGALWFGPIFGKMWMKIHHGDAVIPKSEMDELKKGMLVLMVIELIASILMTTTLAFLVEILSGFSGVHIAFLVWVGFVLPTTVSNVLWGSDKKKMMLPKVVLSTSFRLLVLLLAGYLFSGF